MSTPPVSIRRKRAPAHSQTSSLRSRVTPGVSCTTAARVPVRRLTSVDLPTFGKPTTATVPAKSVIARLGRRARADDPLDAIDDLVGGEVRRVDQLRVLGRLHAGGVALIAGAQVGGERVRGQLGTFGQTPARPD